MALFKYQARKADGQMYEKEVEAADRLALYTIIREEGGSVVSIREVKSILPSLSLSFSPSALFGRIKTQEKINFARNLGTMIEAGLSVTRALEVMGKQTKREPLRKLLSELEADVSRGQTLSEALAERPRVFSALFISMVKAGEESGSISQSLRIVAGQMEKSYLLAKKVRGAMIYPAVIIAVMVVISVLLLVFMVPTLTATFQGLGIKLPLSTRVLIFTSSFLVNNSILVLGAAVSFILLVIIFFNSRAGHSVTDRIYLKLPVIGNIVKEVQVARVSRTLSSLLAAGVEIVAALDVTARVLQNRFYKESLEEARNSIQKGELLSAVLARHEDIYPAFISEMAAVGEETGKISEMLRNTAEYYEEEVDQRTKDLSTIIEPVLMIIIGAGVGLFAISMLAPTYSLVDYI